MRLGLDLLAELWAEELMTLDRIANSRPELF